MKQEILKLRAEGKTYNQIQGILGCSKGTISYHCGEGQKERHKERRIKNKGQHLICSKIDKFFRKALRTKADDFQRERIFTYNKESKTRRTLGSHLEKTFKYKDIIEKFGVKTKCYLTGREINLFEPKTYHFDHKIPCKKGGENNFNNLGIACKEANMAKSDMLLEDFFNLCKEVLEYNGYKVEKI